MLLGSLRSTKEVQDMSTKFMYSGSIAMGLSMEKRGWRAIEPPPNNLQALDCNRSHVSRLVGMCGIKFRQHRRR